MTRNDGIDRTFARNQDLPTLDDVAKVQEHNEREKDSYSNQDIDTTQTIFYKGIMPSEKILDFPVDCNFLTGSVNL